jgi:pantoate--beta-alanine ligase
MGALHKGHLTLIETSKKENDITVCSIFVNPTQFNNPDDFKHYPVTIDKDVQGLIGADCDILFLPSVSEIYPEGYQKTHYELGEIETTLEGFHRPGHFQGVCQVVDRLLTVVNPHNLYMGQKDFQQCMVIEKLLQLTSRKNEVTLKIVPTIRESDGLAMSSRNLRLGEEERKLASALHEALNSVKQGLSHSPINFLKSSATNYLEAKGFLVDYLEVAQAATLEPTEENKGKLVALVAASIGNIRLIDNLLLN